MRKASGGLGRRCQGHGGGGRFEDKLKKIWHRWSWHSVDGCESSTVQEALPWTDEIYSTLMCWL